MGPLRHSLPLLSFHSILAPSRKVSTFTGRGTDQPQIFPPTHLTDPSRSVFILLFFCIFSFFLYSYGLEFASEFTNKRDRIFPPETNVDHIGALAYALSSFFSLCFLTLSLFSLSFFFFKFARNDVKEKNLIPLRITVVS